MVADLPEAAQAAVKAYLLERSPGSPEIADALLHVAMEISREHLRTKELIETVEAVRHAGAAIAESRRKRRRSAGTFKGRRTGGAIADRLRGPTAIYDMACGECVLVLLALRTWWALHCIVRSTPRVRCSTAVQLRSR